MRVSPAVSEGIIMSTQQAMDQPRRPESLNTVGLSTGAIVEMDQNANLLIGVPTVILESMLIIAVLRSLSRPVGPCISFEVVEIVPVKGVV